MLNELKEKCFFCLILFRKLLKIFRESNSIEVKQNLEKVYKWYTKNKESFTKNEVYNLQKS